MSRYALFLPGWDEQSIWGYDVLRRTYFAQLYRNTTSGDEEPDLWLPRDLGPDVGIADARDLAGAIVAVLDEAVRAERVIVAMAEGLRSGQIPLHAMQ